METLQTILTRRSIRKYKTEPLPDEHVERILEAAMYAPSARNTQAWQFVVIDDREMLDRIPAAHPYAAMVREAPLVIAVCGDRRLEAADGYLAENCSAATQNMLLAAHDMGYGSCWLGVYPREERITAVRELLELPSYILPISLVVMGTPAEIKSTPKRFMPERVHHNGWTHDEPETGRF